MIFQYTASMDSIEQGSVVIIHCREPREKLWGMLLRLDGVGVVLRGMDLGSVEDWLRQEIRGEEQLLVPSTFFLPMHRVQRMDLDEDQGPLKAIEGRFARQCGRSLAEALEE